MKRALPIIAGILLIAGVTWWVMSTDDQGTNSTPAPTNQPATNTPTSTQQNNRVQTGEVAIAIQNQAFTFQTVKIKKGTKVTWTNQDSMQHNVVSDSDSPNKGLNGPLLSKGESYSFTFDTIGTYDYHCTPHPFMQATVEVVE